MTDDVIHATIEGRITIELHERAAEKMRAMLPDDRPVDAPYDIANITGRMHRRRARGGDCDGGNHHRVSPTRACDALRGTYGRAVAMVSRRIREALAGIYPVARP